jgi:hypothetical protein
MTEVSKSHQIVFLFLSFEVSLNVEGDPGHDRGREEHLREGSIFSNRKLC